jgi:outer membrane lipopolysaccharide assembly protein LptE/RlpB
MKKIIVISLFFLMLQNCGYTPLYSLKQKNNFSIESANVISEDRSLKIFFDRNFRKYKLTENDDIQGYKVLAYINYSKDPTSKDTTGNTVEYKLSIDVRFEISSEKINEMFQVKQSFIMKNFSDKFEEREYENDIKNSMATIILSQFITRLSQFNVD